MKLKSLLLCASILAICGCGEAENIDPQKEEFIEYTVNFQSMDLGTSGILINKLYKWRIQFFN